MNLGCLWSLSELFASYFRRLRWIGLRLLQWASKVFLLIQGQNPSCQTLGIAGFMSTQLQREVQKELEKSQRKYKIVKHIENSTRH